MFSYTFRLRSSFINIFFPRLAPLRNFSPSTATMEPPLRRMIFPAFPRRSGHSSFPPGDATGVSRSHPSPTPQAKPVPRCLVNIILGRFPTGRKRFYNSRLLFPTLRKGAARLGSNGDKSSRWQGTPDATVVRRFLVKVPGVGGGPRRLLNPRRPGRTNPQRGQAVMRQSGLFSDAWPDGP